MAMSALLTILEGNTSPTTALNTPADTATGQSITPTLNFTGTDVDGESVEYKVQIDTVNTFNSVPTTPTRVQSASGVNTTFASSVTSSALGSPLTPGSIILVAWEGDGVTGTNFADTPTDTAGNTYTRVLSKNLAATFDLEIWYAISKNNQASNQVTITDTGAGVDSIIVVEEWTGVVAVSPVDKSASATGSSTALSSGATASTTVANELVWVAGVAAISGNNLSLAGAFTNLTQNSTTFSNLGIASKVVSATGAQTGVMTVSASSAWACAVVTLIGDGTPLLTKLSTTDAGFTAGHPFASGAAKDFTVQAGDSLTSSTTYYWRVAASDPSGTTAYGAWATTRSFTTTGPSASIAQVAATITATGGTQVVAAIRNISITQAAASITAAGGTQSVTAGGGSASASIAQLAASITASGGTQTVATVNNVSITQAAAALTASGGTQTVVAKISVSITQVAATITASGGTQTIATINNVSITQVAANITASGGTQVVTSVRNISISQLAASVTASGGTQVVSSSQIVAIAQLAAALTAAGGTQVIATVQNVSITQVAATITASGGTQAVNATVLASVAISQVGAVLTATGGTQAVSATRNVSITQLAASITASGGTQDIASKVNSAITQLAANITASGGDQTVTVRRSALIDQVAAILAATGGNNTFILPPVFNVTGVIVESLTNQGTDSSLTNVANIDSNDTISDVNTPTNQGSVDSDSNLATVQSGTNERTLEA